MSTEKCQGGRVWQEVSVATLGEWAKFLLSETEPEASHKLGIVLQKRKFSNTTGCCLGFVEFEVVRPPDAASQCIQYSHGLAKIHHRVESNIPSNPPSRRIHHRVESTLASNPSSCRIYNQCLGPGKSLYIREFLKAKEIHPVGFCSCGLKSG
jgi:predicted Zn-dependent protease